LSLPTVEIFTGVGVDRLIWPAVVPDVEDPITRKADLAGAFRTRRCHEHRAIGRPLIYAGSASGLPRIGPRPADVDGQHSHDSDPRGAVGRAATSYPVLGGPPHRQTGGVLNW
jgi:hypothetical protein